MIAGFFWKSRTIEIVYQAAIMGHMASENVQIIQQRRGLFEGIRNKRPTERPSAPILGIGIQEHILNSRQQVSEMFANAKPQSYQEYLSLALDEGLNALEDGNYGIGAVIIRRENGKEYVISGHNRMRSEKSTHPHAEEDAFDAIEGLMKGEEKWKERIILEREIESQKEETILVTSLEPCIGCVRRLETHKVSGVFIGEVDDFAGAMLGDREKGLPKLWQWMKERQGFFVELANYEDPNNPNYVDSQYRELISRTFHINRQEIDDEMEEKGLAGQKSLAIALLGMSEKS